MFKKGEFVVCGSRGVCTVEDISKLTMSCADKEQEYYILKPLYTAGSTVYMPVDGDQESVRKVLSHEEADALIRELDSIPVISSPSDKLLEQEYRGCMRTGRCKEWVRILKTTYQRKCRRQEMGRKVTAVDAKYSRIAQESLFGELSVALDIPREQVAGYIEKMIKKCLA